MAARAELLASFTKALAPAGVLDRFQVAGALASWWGASLPDLKALAAQGFGGLVGFLGGDDPGRHRVRRRCQ